jgi:hypothetical protein
MLLQRVALVEQSCEHLPGSLRERLIGIHERCEFLKLADALWNGQTKLSGQTAHGVRQHRLLLDQKGSLRMQGLHTLLLQVLGRHELHVGPGGGRAKGHRVSGVVFLPLLHEGLNRLGRNQLHVVSETAQYASPEMRRAACFYHDPAGSLLLEEWDQLTPSQLAPDVHASGLIDGVNLKDRFRGIQADRDMLIAVAPCLPGCDDPYCGTLMPVGGPSAPSGTEIDALVTALHEIGQLVGIKTPTVDTVLALQERGRQAGLYAGYERGSIKDQTDKCHMQG